MSRHHEAAHAEGREDEIALSKHVLADTVLELLRAEKPTDQKSLLRVLDRLPEHPRSWDLAIMTGATSRWAEADKDLCATVLGILALQHHKALKRERRAKRIQAERAQAAAYEESFRRCTDAVRKIFAQASSGIVGEDGAIDVAEVHKAIMACGIDVSKKTVRRVIRECGAGTQDAQSHALFTPEGYRSLMERRKRERAEAEERENAWWAGARTWLDAWIASPHVISEPDLQAELAANTEKRLTAVRQWLKDHGMVTWSWQGGCRRWGTAADEAAARREKRVREWNAFLARHDSDADRTRKAWSALGMPGSPEPFAFYAPRQGLPTFLKKKAVPDSLVRLSDADLRRVPPGVEPVAVIQQESGWYYHHYPELFRAQDLQPFSTRLLVQPECAARPPHIRPPHARRVTLRVGPVNSGKTHEALRRLAQSSSGAYLAPLRLLAWEAHERLNAMGCPTRLVTGEETLDTPGARVTAATVEMAPRTACDTVVVDEAQMVADRDRGWAWARALALADAQNLEVCCAPEAAEFLQGMFASWGDDVSVVVHERLSPLRSEATAWTLESLPPRTAVVAFSRTAVLRWKAAIERTHPGATCAVIYGALPPDVRREQARLVQSGSAEFVAATDAIGLGLNLPIDHIAFAETEKFDGERQRPLTPVEVRQIAGRAGRFGLSREGTFGGVGKKVHKFVVQTAERDPSPVTRGVWQPTLADLDGWPWRLGARLQAWRATVKPHLPPQLKVAPLTDMLRLACLLPAAVEAADISRAFRLVTAPVGDDTVAYWQDAVSRKTVLRAPGEFTRAIRDDKDLAAAERALHEHDLCLWLTRHRLFTRVPDEAIVRRSRDAIARAIHRALSSRQTFIGCRECGCPLPPTHRYPLCEDCFHAHRPMRYAGRSGFFDDEDFDEENFDDEDAP